MFDNKFVSEVVVLAFDNALCKSHFTGDVPVKMLAKFEMKISVYYSFYCRICICFCFCFFAVDKNN